MARGNHGSLPCLNADQSDKTTGGWGNRCRDPSVSSADEARRPPVGAAGRDLRRRHPGRPLPGLPRGVRPWAHPPRGWHRSAPVPPHRGRRGRGSLRQQRKLVDHRPLGGRVEDRPAIDAESLQRAVLPTRRRPQTIASEVPRFSNHVESRPSSCSLVTNRLLTTSVTDVIRKLLST